MGASGPPVALVVGLGNPGPKYDRTRHNAGFWFVDEVARRYGGSFRMERKFHGEAARVQVDGAELHLLRPATFMNHSGRAVGAYASFFRLAPESILVAHDEIDLPPGAVRLKQGGGHGGHNGLRDSIAALGSRDFGRLRIGVGHPGHRDGVIDYVLTRASAADQAEIDRCVEAACAVLPWLVEGEWDRAFQRLHTPATGDNRGSGL